MCEKISKIFLPGKGVSIAEMTRATRTRNNNPFSSPLFRMIWVSWYQKNIRSHIPCLYASYTISLI